MRLPDGLRLVLAADTIVLSGGGVLVGGSPLTALRLSRRATSHLVDGAITVVDDESALLAERLVATNLAHPDADLLPAAAAEDLTVVIPVKDRPHQLDRALSSLTGLECIVVDDGSEDSTAVGRVAARHSATYVRLPHNLGPAGARNAGLARVTTPLVAFVDSDVQVTPHALLDLTRHFQDPRVDLVGPRVVGVSAAGRRRWFEAYDEHSSSLTLGTKPASVRPGGSVGWLPAACLVARAGALAGGFDEDMRVGEDVDLVWRLVENGRRVRYVPTVTAAHDTRTTVRAWLGRKFFYGTGSALLAQRHGNAVAPAVLSPWFAAAGAACLLRRPVLAPVVAAALVQAVRTLEVALPEIPERRSTSGRIAMRGLGWAVRQEASLTLRHWWPLAAVGSLWSSDVRRVVVSSLAVDAAVQVHDGLTSGRVPRPSDLLARRLDDVAYGAGLWVGCLRTRRLAALLPRRPGASGRPRRTTARGGSR